MIALIVLSAASCSASTSPESRALDGPWTSGHACLALGLNLNWTDADVSGTGMYRTDIGPVSCNVAPMLGASGTSALEAHRTSSTSMSGTMTFDGHTRATFTATLATSSPGHIDGSVTTPDGSTMAVTLTHGLVP